jgi:lysosome membrane protein 2
MSQWNYLINKQTCFLSCHQKNGTDDGDLEVDAGLTNTEDFGRILSWRGKRELHWWKEGSSCNDIKGTDGSIFAPFVTKKRTIRIFNAELCRSLFLTYERDMTFLGIPSYRFTAPKEMLEDPRTSDDNRCFCSSEDEDDCLHAGAIDLGPCRDGKSHIFLLQSQTWKS